MMQKKIITIIADDERNNLDFLHALLRQHCKQLHIAGLAEQPEEALMLINRLKPDLLFLDIDMPGMTGFELLEKLEPLSFEVIFVTAYNRFAQDAFDYNAVGYITKPVNTEKLITAVERAQKRIENKESPFSVFGVAEQVRQKHQTDKIPLPTTQGLQFVRMQDICYCESSGNYTRFHFNGSNILVSRQLGEYEKLLPADNFMRIHDKFIINLDCIKEYIKGSGGEVKLEDGTTLPVASRRKEDFLSGFDKWLRRK